MPLGLPRPPVSEHSSRQTFPQELQIHPAGDFFETLALDENGSHFLNEPR